MDIGAHEFQAPQSVISYAWLQQYGLPNNGSADYADTDKDGMNNWQEWVCATDPTSPSSSLRIIEFSCSTSGTSVTWQSVSNRNYFVQRSTNLVIDPAFSMIKSAISGQPGTTSFSDTKAIGRGSYYYRVGVQQ